MDNPAFRSNEDVNQTRVSRAWSSWSSRLHLDRVRIRPVNIPNLNWRRRIPRPDWSVLRKRLRLPRDCSLSKAQVKGLKMPPTRNRKGWCGCFQKDEPPEITYCVVDQNGMLRLQAMTPTQPMPDEEELNAKFAELVEELDLTPPNKAAMLNLPPEKKWQIYCNRKKDQDTDTSLSNLPEHYIEKVNAIATLNYPEEDPGEVETRTKMIDSLKTALRTQPNSFVLRFVELDGLSCLLNALLAMDVLTAHSSIHTALIGCLKALMNNSTGRAHVLAHPSSIKIIAQSLACDSPKTKSAVLEILGAVCLVPGGHRKVLEAMLHFQEFAGERTRFQTILNDLDRNTGVYKEDVGLKTAIMSFLNAVLNYGPGEDNLEFRLHLRYELLMLGIQPVIDKLRSHENETLDRHLDFFEMVRNEDEREMARRYEEVHIDSKSATAIFECLRKKLTHSAAYPHFMSLLQHCLLLPLDYGAHPYHWLLFDRIVQQIVLQTENGENYDISALEINVKELVHLLATEQELVAAQTKAEEFEKENGELLSRVAAKEQELDLRLQEKEDVEASLARAKDKLERETSLHLEAKQKVSELEYQLSQLQSQLQNHISGTGTGNTANYSLAIVAPKPPPPPPPMAPLLPSGGPPPPPPPGLPPPPMMMPTAKTLIKKDVPPSSAPLKSFNWSKLPDHKVPGTIWAELEESKMYKVIDLEDFDKLFSAYQKNGLTNEGSVEDLRQMGRTQSTKQRVLSLVDSRRAQNCTILLSRLKMANEDITRAILGMDSRDNLPIDMVEQLLKFIPSTEERALLEEHAEEVDNMARADKFLYDISRIPHYEQRLQSLYYKKRFTLSLNELKPKIKAILEASKEISRSKKLKRVLEIVLAVGNYMNRGQRGNAGGFRLSSLNKLADTKSSTTKNVTLLHYLVETLENKFKDVLMLEQDMPHIREAAKVSLAELEKEMGQLRQGLHAVEKEMEFHRTQAKPFSPHDRFVPAMKEFVSFASTQFSELEDNFHDMKIRYEKAVTLFGDDPSSMPPEEFFGVFDVFLTSLVEARQEIEAFKKRKEEEERRAQQEAELRKRTIERKHSKQHNGVLSRVTNGLSNGHANGTDKGEFDDLISALRTGDVFGEDLAKMRRNRRRASAASSSPTRNSASSLLSRESSRERVIRKNAP